MKKLLLIAQNELIYTLSRKSFWIAMFAVPLFSFFITWISFIGSANENSSVPSVFNDPVVLMQKGVVDQSGLVKTVPAEFDGVLNLYPDMDAANAAVAAHEIQSYYVIAPDYLASGKVQFYRADFNPVSGWEDSDSLNRLMAMNLLPDRPEIVERSGVLMNRTREQTGTQRTQDPESMVSFFLPYVIMLLLYITIFGSASYLLNSVTNEKQNRVIEILAVSVKPTDLMIGKVLALGLVGLVQTVFWALSGWSAFKLMGLNGFDFSSLKLTPVFMLITFAYYILGYLLYAGLMAAAGALVPSVKEASQITFLMVVPLVIPLMFINIIVADPDGVFMSVLSIFPFTSPVSMPSRMAMAHVPFGHQALSLILLAATVAFVLRSAAGVFRASNLLTGKAVNLKVFLQAMFGRS